MSQNRKLINSNEQADAINIMMRFKRIHDDIQALEIQMKEIQTTKDTLLDDLEMARADDKYYQSKLEMIYGPGQLDTTTLEWVTKNDEDEDTNDNV